VQPYAQPAAAGAPHPPPQQQQQQQQQPQQAMSAEQLSADIDCAKAGVFCTGGAQQSRRHGAGYNSWMASNPVFGHGKSGESGNSGGDI
jgi:succinate dehydrogenase/fumarate reductase-like Fe-S protein